VEQSSRPWVSREIAKCVGVPVPGAAQLKLRRQFDCLHDGKGEGAEPVEGKRERVVLGSADRLRKPVVAETFSQNCQSPSSRPRVGTVSIRSLEELG
jgi:hypothetical protein